MACMPYWFLLHTLHVFKRQLPKLYARMHSAHTFVCVFRYQSGTLIIRKQQRWPAHACAHACRDAHEVPCTAVDCILTRHENKFAYEIIDTCMHTYSCTVHSSACAACGSPRLRGEESCNHIEYLIAAFNSLYSYFDVFMIFLCVTECWQNTSSSSSNTKTVMPNRNINHCQARKT